MKIARQQVKGSLLASMIVLVILLIQAWPTCFQK
jgi:hypothetical protein